MTSKFGTIGKLVCTAVFLVTVQHSPMAETLAAEHLEMADIVFAGTVEQVGAVSFQGVPPTPRTLVVRIDAVFEAPAIISIAAGDKVTVAVNEPEKFKSGTSATFFATGWILGEGIAVREIRHELEPTQVSAALANEKRGTLAQMRQESADAELRARIQAADAVVVGRVVAVRAATMARFTEAPKRITEHDPNWQEAVIKVESAIKGATANQEIVVRFPASLDVQWFDAPKFTVGQEGTFLLKSDAVTGTPRALHAGRTVTAFTALTTQDVFSKDDAERLRALSAP